MKNHTEAMPGPMRRASGIAFLLVLITWFPGPVVEASAQNAGPLASYQWKNRPLLVFAPARDHPDFREQVRRVNADRAGVRDRDMVLVEAVGTGGDASALRTRFRVKRDAFAVILVGKDGTGKRRWTEPAAMAEVFRLIDGMPMRQQEMRRSEP